MNDLDYVCILNWYLNSNVCGCRRANLPGQLPVGIYTVDRHSFVIHSILPFAGERVNL